VNKSHEIIIFLKSLNFDRILESKINSTAKAQGFILSESAAGNKISKNFQKESLKFSFFSLTSPVVSSSYTISSFIFISFLKKLVIGAYQLKYIFFLLSVINGTQIFFIGIEKFLHICNNSSLFFLL
jgi:hypothetical protein